MAVGDLLLLDQLAQFRARDFVRRRFQEISRDEAAAQRDERQAIMSLKFFRCFIGCFRYDEILKSRGGADG